MFKQIKTLGAIALTSLLFAGASAQAATTIKIQSVLSNKADEIVMLRDFADTVDRLTEGEVKFEILPNNSVVPAQEIMLKEWPWLVLSSISEVSYSCQRRHPSKRLIG